ncbi:DUF3106 domain-containing protein [Variovorax sp. PCZ-1]|uniref:DUF3106 domain-containing protein n=1 Tax=Variovorax sp. PCZ-1 TaxID=2835533 RepID=UPI001BD136B6|nr:DUF3106 domain-containing protein [Variovorax sp. PCZ-1]MBS7807599.1 DUF3106 domain-containing protein [Variovorax sp. PCZ-1]
MRSLLLVGLLSLVAASRAFAQAPVASVAPTGKALQPQSVAQVSAIAGSQPLWKDLSQAEQAALRPLAANWDAMAVGQKRKWQTVAKDFDKLPAAQQSKMHARMTEWTALSPQQRADARINFAQNRELTDGLTPEQRKVQWQAYQQLSPEEKRKLAESAPKASIAGAAPAARPQPVLRKEPAPEFGTAKVLANAKTAPVAPAPGKRIAVAPHVAAQGSILPGHAGDAPGKP